VLGAGDVLSVGSVQCLLTTSALSTEVLESALLSLEQISTRITVLALNASRNPDQSLRVRRLLGEPAG
jgi:hypothetical protein